jgi:hypothetical protein
VEWLVSFPVREFHPLEPPSLAWRTEAFPHVDGIDGHEYLDARRKAQHAGSSRSLAKDFRTVRSDS